eukprot:NODE_1831_length_1054_cov_290.669670.p1 GENE.NODE_1831_length_1054_cov_290.669670~~NODE_1831_length_1054_cov_290.669670.p1  ORF type:complete len:291 (+),score=40.28 NODE_1831_length_1054_cov_290.669670:114-986(+)
MQSHENIVVAPDAAWPMFATFLVMFMQVRYTWLEGCHRHTGNMLKAVAKSLPTICVCALVGWTGLAFFGNCVCINPPATEYLHAEERYHLASAGSCAAGMLGSIGVLVGIVARPPRTGSFSEVFQPHCMTCFLLCAILGFMAGLILYATSTLVAKLKIDGPLTAFAICGACSAWCMTTTPLASLNEDVSMQQIKGEPTCLAGKVLNMKPFAVMIMSGWKVVFALFVIGVPRAASHFHVTVGQESVGLDGTDHASSLVESWQATKWAQRKPVARSKRIQRRRTSQEPAFLS